MLPSFGGWVYFPTCGMSAVRIFPNECPHRQSILGEPTGKGDRRQPYKVSGPVQAQQGAAQSLFLATDLHYVCADRRRSNGRRRGENGVHARENGLEIGADLPANGSPAKIVDRPYLASHLKPLAHIFAVIRGTRREPAGGLVKCSRLR